MKNILLVLICLFSLSACNNSTNQSNNDNNTTVMKLYISDNGSFSVNGTSKNFRELNTALLALKAENGEVHYSRAAGINSDSPLVMEIVNLVIQHQLPIKIYTDSTFSTTVDMH